MKIYLFRHGETEWNRTGRLQGQSDIFLSEDGWKLAMQTAEAMGGIVFDRAFCSPLKRAEETAQILLGCKEEILERDGRLTEMGFGVYEGVAFSEAKRDPAHPLYGFFCCPERYVPPEGAESFQQVAERGREFLEERILPLEGSCENVLVVAHGAFNRVLLNWIEGIPLERFWQLDLPNCAASILSLEKGRLKILEAGRVYYGTPVNGRP